MCRPRGAGGAGVCAPVSLKVLCGAECAMQSWAVGRRGRAGNLPPRRRCAGARAVRPCGCPRCRHEQGHCVCLCGTQPGAHYGVQLVGRLELSAGGEPHALRRRRSPPSAHRHVCVIAGLRGERRAARTLKQAASGERRAASGLLASKGFTPHRRKSGARPIRRQGDDVNEFGGCASSGRIKCYQPSPKPSRRGAVQGAEACVSIASARRAAARQWVARTGTPAGCARFGVPQPAEARAP